MSRLGILDLIAAALVAVVLLMPGRDFLVDPVEAGDPETAEGQRRSAALREIARGQAILAEHPGDGAAAESVADALRRIDMHQAALRVAGDAYVRGRSWRAALAVSSIHADRVEVEPAFAYASKALEACDARRAECPGHDRVRMEVYHSGLQAGLKSGVDPRRNPQDFRREVMKAFPRVRSR